MKKVILSSLLGLFAIIGAKAQADSDLVQIGVKGGVNFANITGDDFGDPDARTGLGQAPDQEGETPSADCLCSWRALWCRRAQGDA